METPTKRKGDVPNTPELKKFREDRTEALCTIMRVSDLLLSPTKPTNKNKAKNPSGTKWCEFSTVTTDGCMCRSVTFADNHHAFLKSKEMENVVNNPGKAIKLINVIHDKGGYKMDANSQFGEVVELPKPYKVSFPPVQSIFNVLYHLPIDTNTSIEGVVVKHSITTNPKCQIFTYTVSDGQSNIDLSSYQRISAQTHKSYIFNNVLLEVFQNKRLLKFQITSSLKPSKNKFDAAPAQNDAMVVSFVSIQKEMSKTICSNPNCDDIEVEVDEDGLFECPNCEKVAKLDVETAAPAYNIIVECDNGTQKTLMMTEKVFKSTNVQSKKGLFASKWKISIDGSTIDSIVKD